jgi:thiosulfate dehydrogenase (quinone) large subunit
MMMSDDYPNATLLEDSHRVADQPWNHPALRPALALLPLRLFLAAGWLRAGAEKFIDQDWWTGDTLRGFLDTQHDVALPYFQPVMEGLIRPFAVEVATVVAVAQILIGLGLIFGRPLRVALWAGVVLNVIFVMAGRVNPSAFYLIMESGLLFAVSIGVLDRAAARPSRRSLALVVGWLGLAAVNVPFIETIEPAKVIEDPAMMLTFLCVVVAVTTTLRWTVHHAVAITVVTGINLGHVWSWLRCQPHRDSSVRIDRDWSYGGRVDVPESAEVLGLVAWAPPEPAPVDVRSG